MRPNQITKLCRVHTVDKSKKDGRRYVHYYYVDKKWDNPNYAEMITDYKAMDSDNRKYTEEVVSEMFTAEEVELLKVYFEQEEDEIELFVQEHPLPLSKRQLHDRNELLIGANTFKHLSQQDSSSIVYTKNNGLPFKVAGIRHDN